MRRWLAMKSGSDGLTFVSRMATASGPAAYQPQQSVLNPQSGQRQTACMRYISAPQRSHSVLSALHAGVGPMAEAGRVIGRGRGSSAIARIIARSEERRVGKGGRAR